MILTTARTPHGREVCNESFLAHGHDRFAGCTACLHELAVQLGAHLAVELLGAAGDALAAAVIGRQLHALLAGATLARICKGCDLWPAEGFGQRGVHVFEGIAAHRCLAFMASFLTAAHSASISARASLACRASGCSGPVLPLLRAEM